MHKITLFDKEVESIIDALIFLSCTDACYDYPEIDSIPPVVRHLDNDFKLKLAKRLKDLTNVSCSKSVYFMEEDKWGYEDAKESHFAIKHFKPRIEKPRA